MKIEVLVSTMNQKDNSLIEKMNIRTDVLIINQTKNNKYEELCLDNKNIRIISNNQRGLSRSRNQALLHANGDICVIADDDIKYNNNYEKIIKEAFDEIKDADIIVFNTTMLNYSGNVKRSDIKKNRRAPRYRNYGSVRIAFKKESFLKKNIWFNIFFGSGSMFGAGEESLVFREANKKGLRIYEYPANIAEVDYSTSTWFNGYNEEYFYNKGAYLAAAYPKLKAIYKYYFIFRLGKYSELSIRKILNYINDGFDGYNNLIEFERYYEGK